MADCPQCHTSIEIPEQNFGTLFTCPACHAVYFVGWDGVPEQPQGGGVSAPALESGSIENQNSNPLENDFSMPMEIETPIASPAVHVDDSPNFQDVVDFGNSPQLEGSLTYTVFIKGIDIADTREKIKDALIDSRFAWDTDTVMGRIQNGALTLPDLSPAKAVVLINRIKYLPIEVSWSQNVLS